MRSEAPPQLIFAAPFVVVYDDREKTPFTFEGISGGAKVKNRPLLVETVRQHLPTGDYTIRGLESRVAVERKSAGDFVGTLTAGRRRFQRELQRLDAFDAALIAVEAPWDVVLRDTLACGGPRGERRVSPRSLLASVVAWQQRHRGTHWLFAPDRRFAEVYSFRFLERYWRDHG